MKVCILSSSHVASIKFAWNDVAQDFPFEMVFFGSPALSMHRLRVNTETRMLDGSHNNGIAKNLKITSGGLDGIAVDDFDVFWLYSLDLVVPRLDLRLSRAVQERAISGMAASSLTLATVNKLRQLTDKPIVISPEPLLADLPAGADVNGNGIAYPDYAEICARLAAEPWPENCHFLWQPTQTHGPLLSTLPTFSVESERMTASDSGKPHKTGDVRHMNRRFGAIMIAALHDMLPTLAR